MIYFYVQVVKYISNEIDKITGTNFILPTFH